MNPLIELSQAFAAVVAHAGRSVVRIDARRAPASGAVWSADGLVVTASHVLERDDELAVSLPDGTTLPALLLGRDVDTDVALLRVEAQGLVPAAWDDAPSLATGQLVLALSRPGRAIRAHAGIVSALAEGWRTPSGGTLDRYVELDVALHPGFSGGVVVDAHGKVVGLDTAGILRGHALAVPTPTLRRVVAQLLEHGSVRKGYLGIGTLPVPLGALASAAGQDRGLLVTAVEPDGPASAGLLLGDVLLAFDGRSVRAPNELVALLDEERIGRAVPVRVVRAGRIDETQVTVGARAAACGTCEEDES